MCLLEQFTQWDVVLTIGTLATFLLIFIKPIITLVKTLTRLVTVVDALEKHCAKNEDTNATEHKEFKDKLEDHDELINKHEGILTAITSHTQ